MNEIKSNDVLSLMNNEQLIGTLLGMPNKILRHHEVDGLVQMVLHELAHQQHLDLKRATYLVDSPDFDCLRGVAGFCRNECSMHKADMWQQPADFHADMRDASFHSSMQKMLRSSLKRSHLDLNHLENIISFGKDLGMEAPEVYVWNLKRGNHGILIYEEGAKKVNAQAVGNVLDNVSALLGLCHA